MSTEVKIQEEEKSRSQAPSFRRVMWKEISHDKVALVSLIFLVCLFLFVFISAIWVQNDTVVTVDLRKINKPPSVDHILGTDPSGRDMYTQLLVGARNSIAISLGITLLCGVFGTVLGLLAGYYSGWVDQVVMRVIDFISMLPRLMLIIVIVSVIPRYGVIELVLVLSAFSWMFDARLIRAKALQQSSLDYVSAAKTLGTANWKIMFMQVLPNIASITIVNLTLNLAGNMGVEVGLSFLGFGLPFKTPSLGTLLSYAGSPENLRMRWWLWLPAALLILVMMLGINFVGQAIKRAADAKQRIG